MLSKTTGISVVRLRAVRCCAVLLLVTSNVVFGQLGTALSAPLPLHTSASSDAGTDTTPQLVTDEHGTWIAVWTSTETFGDLIGSDGDILVATSTDNGATWTAPIALNTNANTDLATDSEPCIATDGQGHWLVVWSSSEDLDDNIGNDADIFVARSTNNGSTWTAPAILNSTAEVDIGHDTAPAIATDGAGLWVAVWQSNESIGGAIGTDYDLFVARSADNGASWSDAAVLNTNALIDIGTDADPQITTDRAGNWLVVWSSNENLYGLPGTDFDILIARSSDGGLTWSTPEVANINALTDSGIDLLPRLLTDRAGTWIAVWASDDPLSLENPLGADLDILFARSSDNGVTWSVPQPLNTTATENNAYADLAPQLATDRAGNWIAVWYSNQTFDDTTSDDFDILISLSTDHGASWTAPQALNTNANIDTGSDLDPHIVNDAQGNWVVAWSSTDSLREIIGNDPDVLFTRFVLPDCNTNGIGDRQDLANGTSTDCNSNDVPDDCETDSDSDGLTDVCDGCPNDAGKSEPGTCGCGTADTDNDADGTADCIDHCPQDSGKIEPGMCGCGTPETDTDSDGTPDCLDACPQHPSKTVPGLCGCGSPDTDSDSDGTPDCLEAPPNPPTGVTAEPGTGCGDVVLHWNASADATSYRIHYGEDSRNPPFEPAQNGNPSSGADVGNVTEVTISGLTPGTAYNYAVTAVNAVGESSYTPMVNQTTGDHCAGEDTGQEIFNCGAGLCGLGTGGLLPMIMIGLWCMKRRITG